MGSHYLHSQFSLLLSQLSIDNARCDVIEFRKFLWNRVSAMSASAPASPSESEGEDSSDIVITEETETESSLSSEQPNLLAHPKVKSKCWRFFGFST